MITYKFLKSDSRMLIPLKTALAMQHIPYKRARLYKCTSWACAKLFHICYFFYHNAA